MRPHLPKMCGLFRNKRDEEVVHAPLRQVVTPLQLGGDIGGHRNRGGLARCAAA